MFEKEAEEYAEKKICEEYVYGGCMGFHKCKEDCERYHNTQKYWKDGAEFGYNKANEWHYVKDGDLPRQYGYTCFSIDVLANNKKWVYYEFSSGKWFCGNKEVKVIAWKEIELPALPKEIKK